MKLIDLHLKLPHDLQKLIDFVDDYGFEVGIIGGWVRDYFLEGSISNDFDIELRPKDEMIDFVSLYENLVEILEKTYEIEHLAYNVTKIQLADCEAELTLPRVENYTDEFHHSNFTATFIADIDYQEGYKRRDLTINAMCLAFRDGSFVLVDPLAGYDALKSKKLIPCGEDFYKDPVRFLRAIRFGLKLDFEIDKEIEQKINSFKSTEYSAHYIKMEAMKSKKPIQFLNKFFSFFNYKLAEHTLIDAYESEFASLSFEDFFKNIIFLNNDFLTLVSGHTGISLKHQYIDCLKFKELINTEYQAANLKEKVKVFRHLVKLSSKVQNFYAKNAYIDLDASQFQKMRELKVDVSAVPNNERSEFELYEKLKVIYAN